MRTLAANILHALARLCFAGERACKRVAAWMDDASRRLEQMAGEN